MKKRLLLVSDNPLLFSGLGRWCRELAYRLQTKYDIAVAGWHYGGARHSCPFHIYPIEKLAPNYINTMVGILEDFQPDIVLGLGDLDYFLPFLELKKIFSKAKVINWYVYLTVDGQPLNPAWKDTIEAMDGIATCTNYGRKWLKVLSPKVDPEVIYLGFNVQQFGDTYSREQLKAHNNMSDTFIMFNNQQNTVRHNISTVIWAFKDFVDKHPDAKVKLICNNDPEDIGGPNLVTEVARTGLGDKIVLGINKSVMRARKDEDINGYYNLSDLSVFGSCNEGFGLPLLEGYSVGLPAIGPDYASLSELITPETGWKVQNSGFLVTTVGIRQGLISQKQLAEAMGMAYDEWLNDRPKWEERRIKCKEFANKYTWNDCAEGVAKLLDHRKTKCVGKTGKIGIISPWNEQCGIGEHTKLFVKSLSEEYVVFACSKRSPFEVDIPDEENVIRCWDRSFNDYGKLLEAVDKSNIRVMHIQHEFSFFENLTNLKNFIRELRKRSIAVVITFHTAANIGNVLYSLAEEADMSTFCFKSTPDWIEDIPFTNISNSIPWMLDEPKEYARKKRGITSNHVIVSNGFWQAHKGYAEMITLLPKLKEKYPDILYVIVGSHGTGSAYVEQVKKMVEQWNLKDNVLIDDHYVATDILMDYLHSADVIVYNYNVQFQSSSAAVLTGLSAHRPVITTDSPMFDNMTNEVIKVKTGDPAVLATAIESIFEDDRFAKLCVKRGDSILKQITPEITAQKYENIYKAVHFPLIGIPEKINVCIGIPTYNDFSRINNCISSIKANTDFDGRSYAIVALDDGSINRSALFNLRQVCRDNSIPLLEHEFNEGIPASWDDLTNSTDAPNIILFNDDIQVKEKNWLKSMLWFVENNDKIGMVGLPLIQIDVKTGQPNTAYPSPDYSADIGLCGAAVGCSFLFTREAYKQTTGFWRELISFYEEIDFGFQMISKGYWNVMLPCPAVEHWGSQTFGSNKELAVRDIQENILRTADYLAVLQQYSDKLNIKLEEHTRVATWGKAFRMDYSRVMFANKWGTKDKFTNPQAEVHERLFKDRQKKVYRWLDKDMKVVEKEI